MSSTPIDHYDDGGAFLRETIGNNEPPEMMKQAADLSGGVVRHAEDYALVYDGPNGREYKLPIVDAGNAIASGMYFEEYGSELPPNLRKTAAANLSEALRSFGFVPPEWMEKTAAMDLGYSDGQSDSDLLKLFGVTEDDNMEVIHDAFNGLSPRGKRRLVLQVKEASAMSGAMKKYAGTTLSEGFGVSMALRIVNTETDEAHAELSSIMAKSASADLEALAEEIGAFDVKHGLTWMYGRRVNDPYLTVFGEVEKTASAGVVEIGDREYTPDQVSGWYDRSGKNQLTDAFGSDFSEQFGSAPSTVLESLPATHKSAIARMIDEA